MIDLKENEILQLCTLMYLDKFWGICDDKFNVKPDFMQDENWRERPADCWLENFDE